MSRRGNISLSDARDFEWTQAETLPLRPYHTRVADLEGDTSRRNGRGIFLENAGYQATVGFLVLVNVIIASIEVATVGPTHQVCQVLDEMLLMFFIVEYILRIYHRGCRIFWLDQQERTCNIIETVNVALGLIQTSVLPFFMKPEQLRYIGILSFFRLSRIFRLLRHSSFVWTGDDWFQYLSGGVICLNAAVLGFETDSPEPAWWWVNQGILCFFVFEIMVHLGLEGCKNFFTSDEDHFLAKRGKAIFAVPTRVLVEQQAKYCREKCQHRRLVVELSGGEMDSWGKDRWRQCVCENEILVGTPEVFRKALVENGYITPLDFSIIFDECHNATGNSPMAAIMKDAVWKVSGQPGCPRILGLTASYVNGSLKNLEQKREQLETLLQASLFSPDVPAHLVAGGVAGSGSTSKFRYVTFQEDVSREACSEAEKKLDALLGDFQNTVQMQVKECRKLVTRTCHVLEELGMAAFRDALKNCIQPQMDAHAQQLASLADEKSKKLAAHLRSQMPQLTQRLQQLGDSVGTTGQLRGVPTISGKAHRLLELLTTLFQPRSRDGTYRGIIFVTQVALIMPLAHLVNEQFQRTGLHIRAGAVSGVGSMTESVRNQQMDQFRRGEKNLLVCTNALEEGVDVSDCAFVIRFNKFNTTKSHIQGSGRARHENAEIYYFDNHPEEEENKAKRLDQVAKDQDLQLSEKERHRRRLASTKSRPGIYPFHPGDSEVNFFNCLQIVYEYCAKTMGQSFNPDDLFTYSEEQVCVYPPQSRRVVTEMKYPSPVGFVTVTAKEVNDYWGDVKLEEILDPDRCKNLKQEDKTKRRHLFVVAVHMHRNQLLDDKNQPTAAALTSTKLACPAMNLKPGIKMKSTYSSSAAPGVGASTAYPGSTPSTPSPAYTPVTPTMPAPPAPATNGNGGTMALTATTNWKGVLNEWALKTWKKPAEELLKYEEETKPEGFVSKVEVTMLRRSFTGRPSATKKNAQQSAAAEALRQLAIAVCTWVLSQGLRFESAEEFLSSTTHFNIDGAK